MLSWNMPHCTAVRPTVRPLFLGMHGWLTNVLTYIPLSLPPYPAGMGFPCFSLTTLETLSEVAAVEGG